LQRSDVDTSLKDLEGHTAFDLYNSTVNDTKPDARDLKTELYTWGTIGMPTWNYFWQTANRVNPETQLLAMAMAMAMTEHIRTVLSSKSRMTQRRAYKPGFRLSS
jgi:hypothetical protein